MCDMRDAAGDGKRSEASRAGGGVCAVPRRACVSENESQAFNSSSGVPYILSAGSEVGKRTIQ